MSEVKLERMVILGAGRIASGFDKPGDRSVLTHAHAIVRTPGLCLEGFYDRNPTVVQMAVEKWGGRAFDSLQNVKQSAPDWVIICTPDITHGDLLLQLSDWSLKGVICEKPLTTSLKESRLLVDLYASRGIELLVNFQRRFDEAVLHLKSRVAANKTGSLLAGTLYYSKGFFHNGSHGLDILDFLFGKPSKFIKINEIIDWEERDPTISVDLFYGNRSVRLVAVDERHFSIFELDLIFENCRYRFTESGLRCEFSSVKNDPVFAGYRELYVDRANSTELHLALLGLYRQLVVGERNFMGKARDTMGWLGLAEEIYHAPVGELRVSNG